MTTTIFENAMNELENHSLLLIGLFLYFASGGIGISNEMIQSPFTQNGNLVWSDDFEDGNANGWTLADDVPGEPSNWYVEQGYLIQDTNSGNNNLVGTHVVAGDPSWQNYIVRAQIICTDDDYIGMLFRYQDRNNYYRFMLSSERKVIRLDKRVGGRTFMLALYTNDGWPYCTFTATIAALHDTLALYLNDQKLFEIQDSQFDHGKVGFMTCWNNGSFFDGIEVYDRFEIPSNPPPLRITRGPYLQSVLENRAVIMWTTNYAAPSIVEYGRSKTSEWQVSSSAPVTLHEVELDELERETNYYYRVCSDTVISDWYSFKTAIHEDKPFRFIVYGDNRTNFLRHTEIANAIGKHEPDLIINTGDVVQRGLRADWDTEFFTPLSSLLKTTPIYVSIGNHELNASYFYDYFSFPNTEHENYYSFQYGNSFFIFIDNNRAAYPDRDYYPSFAPGSPQHQWLWNQLRLDAAKNADWLFVINHVPCYTVGISTTYTANQSYLVPLFRQYNVNVHFSGHIHDYERGFSDGVHYVISGGGGGPLGSRKRWDVGEITVYAAKYHYCVVDIAGEHLTFVAYDIHDNIIDQFEIDKGTGVENEPVSPVKPESYKLTLMNCPNPLIYETTISVELGDSFQEITQNSPPKIEIYDLLGKRIRVLESGFIKDGNTNYYWDCMDENGLSVPAGVYLYRVQNEEFFHGKIMTIIR